MSFEAAVKATPSVRDAFQKGLRALRKAHRDRVDCRDPRRISGSLDLDSACASSRPNDHRWDYAIGLVQARGRADRVFWVEVHPASSRHVDGIIAKVVWLKRWLEEEAPRLEALPREFVWVASGAVTLPPGDRKRNLLAQHGVRLTTRLDLDT